MMKIKTSGNFNSKQSINLQNVEDNERRYHRSKPQQSPCSDIQALPQRISEELQRNNPETSTLSQKLDEDKLTELISQAVDVALQSRLYDDEKYVDKILLVPLRNLPICIIRSQLTATKMQRRLIAISN